jgi:DNA-binding response OmpR family regulator
LPPDYRLRCRAQEGFSHARPSLEPLPTRRILVLNSHKGSAKELATHLSKARHTAESAEDGPRALEAEPTFRPDIVIIDLASPGMDPCALARSLRAQANRDVMLVADGGSEEDHARAK